VCPRENCTVESHHIRTTANLHLTDFTTDSSCKSVHCACLFSMFSQTTIPSLFSLTSPPPSHINHKDTLSRSSANHNLGTTKYSKHEHWLIRMRGSSPK